MTSPPPTTGPGAGDELDPGDDDVLAVLDDTATAEQRRRVAREPALRARLAEQRTAVEALADPVTPLADEDAARIRARALALLDQDADDADADADADDAPPVASLAPRKASPRRAVRRLPPWPAVAAAVILLMGIGIALIANDRGDDQVATMGRSAESAGSAESAESGGGASYSSDATDDDATDSFTDDGSDGPGAVAPTAGPELPRYEDEEALRRELQDVDPATIRLPGQPEVDSERADEAATLCDHGLQAVEPAFGPVQAARLVVVGQQEVVVVSHPVAARAGEPASTRLTVLEVTSCTPLFAVQR